MYTALVFLGPCFCGQSGALTAGGCSYRLQTSHPYTKPLSQQLVGLVGLVGRDARRMKPDADEAKQQRQILCRF